MSIIAMKGTRREVRGKGGARKTRTSGLIPGVLYGHGVGPLAVSVDAHQFETALRHHKGGNAIINLAVDGDEYASLIRQVQYHPVTHDILHLDFHHISLTEEVTVKVAVHLTGLALGVKDAGGILEGILREIEVRCLPTAIPSFVDVDVSALNIGDSIHVRDISVPDVQVVSDPDDTIATVVPPTVIEEKPAEEVAAVAGVEGEAEPEVIAKGKKEEGEGDKEIKGKEIKGKESRGKESKDKEK